jgi:hypothetical protein
VGVLAGASRRELNPTRRRYKMMKMVLVNSQPPTPNFPRAPYFGEFSPIWELGFGSWEFVVGFFQHPASLLRFG